MLSLAFFVMILACFDNKPDMSYLEDYWGTASARLNGEEWLPLIKSGHNDNYSNEYFDIEMDIYSEEGYLRHTLYISHIPKDIGIQPIQEHTPGLKDSIIGVAFFTSIGHGDAGGDDYKLLRDGSFDNSFELIAYDKSKNEIRGKFQFLFVNKNDAEDVIKFTDGIFYTKISD